MKLEDYIRDHPWDAIAFAALAGVWLAANHPRSRAPSGFIAGVAGTLALQLVREAALRQMSKLARSFIAAPVPPTVPTPYA